MPDDKRNIIGAETKGFVPDYSKSTTKDAGDLASVDFKAAGKAINAAADAKAAEAAIVAAESKKLEEKKAAEDKKALEASEPATMAGKEEKAKKLKDMARRKKSY